MQFLDISALKSPGFIPFQTELKTPIAPQGFQAVLNHVINQGQRHYKAQEPMDPAFLSVNPQMNVKLHHQMIQQAQAVVESPKDLSQAAYSAFHVGISQAIGRSHLIQTTQSTGISEATPASSLGLGNISIISNASFKDTLAFWSERYQAQPIEEAESAFDLSTQHTFFDKQSIA